jgi:putative ABC transport system substrate-binding protein
LRDLGYIEWKNINIEYRFASGRVERLPELAAELVHLKPDVIVTPTTAAFLAAYKAKRGDPSGQSWSTFLHNHMPHIARRLAAG